MPDGFINVLKPPGMTSHDVVGFIRRVYGLKKVGHAGTLDPAAAGVLPVALGKATRLIEYLADADKAYRAELTLGFSTDSGDDTGLVLQEAAFTMPEQACVEAVLQQFKGTNKQIPPIYSAIKINGKRACDLARQNVEVTIPEREIEIYGISLLALQEPTLLFDVNCSKGTYIRTLCMDIGKRLQIPAVMSFLVRTRVGGFCLEEAVTLAEIKANPVEALCQMDSVLSHLPFYRLNDVQAQAFQQGQKIGLGSWTDDPEAIRLYHGDHFIGIGRYDFDRRCLTPVKVIA